MIKGEKVCGEENSSKGKIMRRGASKRGKYERKEGENSAV